MIFEMLYLSFSVYLASSLPIIDWSKFEIYFTIIFVLLFSGLAANKLFGFEKRKSISYIIAFVATLGVAIFVSNTWLHNLPELLRSLGWLLLVLIGLPSAFAILFSAISSPRSKEKEGRRMGAAWMAGGLVGFLLCFVIGWQMIRFPWIISLNWTNPYIYGTVMAVLISIILGLLINALKRNIRKSGNAVDHSAEWRFVGSNSKFRNATTREVYDHQNGGGSWVRNHNSTITFFRWIGCVLATFGPFWLFDDKIHIFTTFRFLSQINFEFSRMIQNQRVGMYVFLFLLSGVITLIFNSLSDSSI